MYSVINVSLPTNHLQELSFWTSTWSRAQLQPTLNTAFPLLKFLIALDWFSEKSIENV